MNNQKKTILGLDLGTTSIGWAHVIEGDSPEQSEINAIGVRVIPLTTDEQTNFEKGKPITTNAERTLKRGARRNLDRYQDRRKNLYDALLRAGIIQKDTILAENGKQTTHSTYALRAKAAVEKIEREAFARVLFTINKKRGYKSSRKAKNDDEGQAIDGMGVAKALYEEKLTPGQYVFQLLSEGKKSIPDFYRSDLQAEFDKVWSTQQQFYPELLTDSFYEELKGKGQRATASIFWTKYQFNTAENKGTRDEKKLRAYSWRSKAVSEQLAKEEVAYVLTEINNNLNNSSGYLGAISDRSKELYFRKQTVGQYLFAQLEQNPHTRMKNQVFYRQDYLDEFEKIWETQSRYHTELTPELKEEIRDIIIFYQRKLKSQKGLVSLCEFESQEKEFTLEGKIIKKRIGAKVAPKSSPLAQEFKIWQVLNNVLIRKKGSRKRTVKSGADSDIMAFDMAAKDLLFDELNLKGSLSANQVLHLLGYKTSEWELNYTALEGNHTNKTLYEAFLKIVELEGYDVKSLLKVKSNKDEVTLDEVQVSANEIKSLVHDVFQTAGIHTSILDFNPELDGKAFEQQASYQLWHLLYAYEGDNSLSGNETLHRLLEQKFGFKTEHARMLSQLAFQDDYSSLSTKAIRKIYPFIRENQFSTACELAGYRHSAASLTKEEIENRVLKDKLELLKKNSLRNPVVEKILNQLVNVVNTLIDTNSVKDAEGNIVSYYKFDEIRIELARELKKNASERAEMTTNINAAKSAHDKIVKILQSEFGIKNPSRNDIIRYRLYEELKNNAYKDLYTDTYIPREKLFSREIDIEHIIPQSRLFDDSFSNKTIVYRQINLEKGNQTAIDYILHKFGEEGAELYRKRLEALYLEGLKNKDNGITKAKYQKLLKHAADIGEGFIERDLRDSQYIAKKAKNMLLEISRSVVTTTGSITDKLREDWGLINIMQELNFEKYKALGLTERIEKKDGTFKERIVDWTKRNDHRHHAMDALTIAFTKHSHIQYLNYLNARKDETHKLHAQISGIERIETELITDQDGNRKRKFKTPIPDFRKQAKTHLEHVLVSFKAKNKVVTKNKNKTATKNGAKCKTELTPRGQLHKETVYGKYSYSVSREEKVSAKFDAETIGKVANPTYRKLLLERLQQFGNDPAKAFGGKNALSKNPIYLDAACSQLLPEKVKLVWLEEDYSIRKDLNADNFKDAKSIEKVIDAKVKTILQERLLFFQNDAKKAFSDLDKNPVWLNKEKGIAIKRVTISGVSNATPLHFKKDHLGNFLLNSKGQKIPADFVSTGNNHHVAIYKDEKGNLQDNIVSFFEAVERVNQGLPVVDKHFNQHLGWQFLFTMKQNEYFVFPDEKTGFNPMEINLTDASNNKIISRHLFRVQKLSKVTYGNSAVREFVFRHHLETNVEEKKELKDIAYKNIKSLGYLEKVCKIRLNHLGEIIHIGEY